jgi:hypothetical protein
MKYALFSVPVGTIYDLPQTIKEGEEGLVSTIGDEGLYGQACQVRTAPGGVTAAGVQLPPDVAEVVSFYDYHGYVDQRELQFVREEELWEYLGADLVLVGRATDVLSLPKVQGVRMMELERGGVLRRQPETAEEAEAHKGWAKVLLTDGRTGYVRDVALEPVKYEMTAVFSQREGLAFNDALAETLLNEQRFRRLNAQQPEVAEQLWKDAAADLQKRYDFLAQLAGKAEKSPSEG